MLVKSLKTGDTLYAQNARKLLMPASNMKIVTLAATAATLGWDFTYETRVSATGPIVNGTLDGDLVVTGSGDPSLMDDATPRPFESWAAALKQHGIQRITGRIVGDDNKFTDEGLGFGWSWDDLVDDYAAGASALTFNESTVRVTVTPAASAGGAAAIVAEPATGGLMIRNNVRTSEAGATAHVETHRLPGSAELELRGSVPLGGAPIVRAVSVDNPTLFFVTALRAALIANGVDVKGPAVDIDAPGEAPVRAGGAPIVTFRSAPLSTLAMRLMKISQNLYAETFLTTLSPETPATAASGRTVVHDLLARWGVADDGLIQRDGSGLSRYDYVTPETLVTILVHVYRDPVLREPFDVSLPIAGHDGGLGNRMKGTAAENNARAKTGSMSNVRALSGYVTDADGEPLVFSIIANNFDSPPPVINAAMDAIIVRLANHRR